MKEVKDNGEWFYDQIKSGKHTPLSNSAVICFLKERMKEKSIGVAQYYASAAFLIEQLDSYDKQHFKCHFRYGQLNLD